MIRVPAATYRAIWALIGICLGAGWVVYGMLASDNVVFRTVMVVASMALCGGTGVLLKRSADT
jgi:hypothetical protein